MSNGGGDGGAVVVRGGPFLGFREGFFRVLEWGFLGC